MIQIIGAGFSGLSLAYHFVKKGYAVTVVEKEAKVGGVIETHFYHQLLIESAANGLLSSKKVEELFSDIGVEILRTKVTSGKKYIYRNGLKQWPLSFKETLESLVLFLKSLFKFSFQPQPLENLKSWADRVLGPKAAQFLIQPMVNGIFAQRIDQLDAQLVLGSLFYKRNKGQRQGLISANKGMGEVIAGLKEYLIKNGVLFEFKKEGKINLDYLQHNTFLAMDYFSFREAGAQSVKLKNFSKKDSLNSLSLVRVTLSFENKVNEIDGFGILFPNEERFHSLGVLSNTKIFENRGDYNESWIFSDSTLPRLLKLTDDEILEKIKLDRKRLFPDSMSIRHYSIHRWPQVIPDYNSSLKEFLKLNEELTNQLSGNYLGVLGLTGIHERNFSLVQNYAKKYKE